MLSSPYISYGAIYTTMYVYVFRPFVAHTVFEATKEQDLT